MDTVHGGDSLGSFADLDWDRAARRGYPEAILCAGKTPAQVEAIAAELAGANQPVMLFTRADQEHATVILSQLPDAAHDATACVVAWPADPPRPTGGLVAIISAGTADLPVAKEAQLTARYLGRPTELVVDVGVAGIHRLFKHAALLRRAKVIIAVAGMDGALPSVVAGLVGAPVIAVPTSTGYGVSLGGIAALMTMLNSCAPGIAVVNIDNGYGAGHIAAQIATP